MTAKSETQVNVQPQDPSAALFQLMERINRLVLKAYHANTLQALKFIILNDTAYVVRYDRAVLWDMTKYRPALLGVSGQAKVNKDAEINQKWRALVAAIPNPKVPQQIQEELFKEEKRYWDELQRQTKSSVMWLPIIVDEKLVAGLWIEKWDAEHEKNTPQIIELLFNYLIQGYAAAWGKLSRGVSVKKLGLSRYTLWIIALLVVFLLYFVEVPLRVVAHCEVVPKDPILITAPLEGIVETLLIKPGDIVQKGTPLFEYDKRAPIHDLKAAQKEVQVMQAEVSRASTLGLSDPRSLRDLGILKLKLEKGLVQLDLAEYRASQLSQVSPEGGVVMIDNPEEWRGKPVKVGEKIMIISNPHESKLRFWLPEDDNILLDPAKNIAIYLNVDPQKKWEAHLEYIANQSTVNEKNMTTFVGEANWVEPPENIKLGLKGTAVLYGENVSLFYYIFRKPWAGFRYYFGV